MLEEFAHFHPDLLDLIKLGYVASYSITPKLLTLILELLQTLHIGHCQFTILFLGGPMVRLFLLAMPLIQYVDENLPYHTMSSTQALSFG